jgi:hypothetical protein
MCPATADIAAHVFANLLRRSGATLIYACYRSHDLARRAIAALERIMINEGMLHWMEFAFLWRHAFNRRHLAPISVHRRGQARYDAPAVEMHRASATLATITTLLRAVEREKRR